MDVADGSIQDIVRAVSELCVDTRQGEGWFVKAGAVLTIASIFVEVARQISLQGGVVGSDLVYQLFVVLSTNYTDGG
mgnify:CR=1 FL=1